MMPTDATGELRDIIEIYVVRDEVICEVADVTEIAGDCDTGFPGYVVRTIRSPMPHRYCLRHAKRAAERLLMDLRTGLTR